MVPFCIFPANLATFAFYLASSFCNPGVSPRVSLHPLRFIEWVGFAPFAHIRRVALLTVPAGAIELPLTAGL